MRQGTYTASGISGWDHFMIVEGDLMRTDQIWFMVLRHIDFTGASPPQAIGTQGLGRDQQWDKLIEGITL